MQIEGFMREIEKCKALEEELKKAEQAKLSIEYDKEAVPAPEEIPF